MCVCACARHSADAALIPFADFSSSLLFLSFFPSHPSLSHSVIPSPLPRQLRQVQPVRFVKLLNLPFFFCLSPSWIPAYVADVSPRLLLLLRIHGPHERLRQRSPHSSVHSAESFWIVLSCPLCLWSLSFSPPLGAKNKGGAAVADLSAKESSQKLSGPQAEAQSYNKSPEGTSGNDRREHERCGQVSLGGSPSIVILEGVAKRFFFSSLNCKSKIGTYILTMVPQGSSRSLPVPSLGLFYGLWGQSGHCRPAVRDVLDLKRKCFSLPSSSEAHLPPQTSLDDFGYAN